VQELEEKSGEETLLASDLISNKSNSQALFSNFTARLQFSKFLIDDEVFLCRKYLFIVYLTTLLVAQIIQRKMEG
jgi:hypothetical protein